MDSAKNELADKLKSSNNVLVTVSRNPSVDQLSALLGLTLLLNKLGKHAAAVFSGEVPSTIEFLQPEDTFEKNTDSLRDFIIALDKGKADKLRYKVEDNVVRIFITPYKTSISEHDLEFSQGDFNVDVVVALGVSDQQDLDQAITEHGRILHDATVATINTAANGGDLGSLNWHDVQASSLSELVTELAQVLGKDLIDGQIATSLLTGIVAETDRFSNDKTSSHTMSASATLMAAGANQQLVASKLEREPWEPAKSDDRDSDSQGPRPEDEAASHKPDDGTLRIDHEAWEEPNVTPITDTKQNFQLPEPEEPHPDAETEDGSAPDVAPQEQSRPMITEPPTLGGTLTASSHGEDLDPSTDPLSFPNAEPPKMYDRPAPALPPVTPDVPEPAPEPSLPAIPEPEPAPALADLTPPPVDWVPPAAPKAATLEPAAPSPAPQPAAPAADSPSAAPVDPNAVAPTLTELEASVHSPHMDAASSQSAPEPAASATSAPQSTQSLDDARDEVSRALSSVAGSSPEPIQALNAQPLGDDLHPASGASAELSLEEQIPGLNTGSDVPETPPAAPSSPAPDVPQATDPNAPPPPPVPPPLPIRLNSPPAQQ